MKNAINQLYISMSPDMLAMARTRKGRVVQAEQIELDPNDWGEHWNDAFMRLDQPLRQLISRFPSRSCTAATVLYHAPNLSMQTYMSDLHPGTAKVAGLAKFRESIATNDPMESCTLGSCSSDVQSTCTMVYSEHEERLRAIYAWLNRCSMRVNAIVPMNVAIMDTAARIAAKSEPDTAVFYIGADVSVMAYANETGLKLIRLAEIGYRKLTNAYIHALKENTLITQDEQSIEDQKMISTIEKDALKMLFEFGIPFAQTETRGIELQSTVLPAIAPVLQRFCIEVKQTFRFGLAGEDAPENLLLCGPGATIPHLSKAVSKQLEMNIAIDPSVEGATPLVSFGRGTLEGAVVESRQCPGGLLPEVAFDARTSKVLARSLFVGGLLAAIAMGGEYAKTTLEYQKISQAMSNEAPKLKAVNGFSQKLASANTMSSIISDVSDLVSTTVEGIPQWDKLLAKLSQITTDSLRVQELHGEYALGVPTVEISGVAVADTEKESGKALNSFVKALQSVEGIANVTLGATSRVSVGDEQWGRAFKMNVTLEQNPLPYKAFVKREDGSVGKVAP